MSRPHILVLTDITEDSWDYGNLPKTTAQLIWKQATGFEVKMRCYEPYSEAVYREADSPVYKDSCMECFLNFYPQDGKKYINFEVNVNGAMLCQTGTKKTGRVFIRNMGVKQPAVYVRKTAQYWEVKYTIPLSLVQAVYGKSQFKKGHIITGNFYKCGDETKALHFGSWKKIMTEKPDFHQPDFFGEIQIL